MTVQTVHELIKSKGVFENQTAEIGIFVYISMFFGWGMGLASNPQYMVRILAAKDKKTAKHMILHALIFLCVLYFALTQIGLGLRILFPQLKNYCSADDVFIYAVVNLMNTPFSGFFLISVIGACVSTANSQLHLIGCMLSYDVAAQITKKKMSEEQILILARVFIFIGGTAALILSVNPPEDMLSFRSGHSGDYSRQALAPLSTVDCTGNGERKPGRWERSLRDLSALSCSGKWISRYTGHFRQHCAQRRSML